MHIFGFRVLSLQQSWLEASARGMDLYVYDSQREIKMVVSGI